MSAYSAPGSEKSGDHHVLHVYPEPDGGDLVHDLFHPGGCARADGVCWIEFMADNCGWSDVFVDFPPGLHRIEPWLVVGGWLTADYAIDWDEGVRHVGDPSTWWEDGRPGPASWDPYGSWNAMEWRLYQEPPPPAGDLFF